MTGQNLGNIDKQCNVILANWPELH